MSMWMCSVTQIHPSRTLLPRSRRFCYCADAVLEDGDYAATAVTFGPQQDIREGIPLTDDDLLLLDDDDEDTEEYDWYNEPPADDFGNLDID